MSSQNNKENSGHDRSPIITGVFVVIGACITGVFLIANTLIEKGTIVIVPTPTSIALIQPSQISPPVNENQLTPFVAQSTAITSYNNPFVSLRDVGSLDSVNLGLPAGMQTFNGVEFEIGWIATTQSKGGLDESKPSNYKVIVKDYLMNSSKVYFLWQASWAVGRKNDEIGSINIHFSNGLVLQEKIVVGLNIRDWSDVRNKLSSPNAQEAYINGSSVVDMYFVEIPADYTGFEITQIDIQDTSEVMGVHLWAITIE